MYGIHNKNRIQIKEKRKKGEKPIKNTHKKIEF